VEVKRTVLTTGANSGIGLATALEVARRGFRSVGSVRSASKAAAVKQAARKAGVEVETVILDVNNAADCRRVIARVKPWGVVNNAGHPASGAIEDVPDREARAVLETMVVAPMRLARLSLPHMREMGEGRIINMSSIAGLITNPLAGWYQASKHALEAASDALRMEVASSGVKVVLIEPGGFKTAIWEENQEALDRREQSRYRTAYERVLRGTQLTVPLMGNPSTVAKVVVRALTSKNPHPRYLVGYDAQLLLAMRKLTPTALRDRVTRITLGL
jgi:NAD(P)-dependent dehydrogenase (short-subunit alcohol dehydrogenase family)